MRKNVNGCLGYERREVMSTQPTIREMQDVIMKLRKFAGEDDYHLCRPYLKSLMFACADCVEAIICARDWEPVQPED